MSFVTEIHTYKQIQSVSFLKKQTNKKTQTKQTYFVFSSHLSTHQVASCIWKLGGLLAFWSYSRPLLWMKAWSS